MHLGGPLRERLRTLRDSVASSDGERWEWLARHPEAVAAALASVFLLYTASHILAPLPPGTWPVLRDSVIFEYGGWYLAEGNRLYVDFWEVKPPVAFELTALLALLTGDDVVLYHVLALLVNGVTVALGAWVVAGLVHDLTDDPLAAVVAGAGTFTLPFYVVRALIGFKSKYFVVAAGCWCLYLAYRRRPLATGVAGALAVGFWQLAVVFPLCGFGRCWQTQGRRGASRFVGGAAATTALVLLPVMLWGAVPAMFAEVLLSPLLTGVDYGLVSRVTDVVDELRPTLPVVVVGVAGLAGGLTPGRIRREWPLVVTAAWFTAQMVLVDFDGPPDAFPWLALLSVGAGLGVAAARRWLRSTISQDLATTIAGAGARAIGPALLAVTVLSVATMGGFGVQESESDDLRTYDTAAELDPDYSRQKAYDAAEQNYVFWNRVEIESCRAFGGWTQRRLVDRAGLDTIRPWYHAPCGQFDRILDAVLQKYGLRGVFWMW